MARKFSSAPSAAEIEAIARAALIRLPSEFKRHLVRLVLLVEDFADDALLAQMAIDNPFDLTGLYEGVPLSEQSVEHSGVLPPRVRLFRRPILDEWAARGDESLEHLIAHVVVHEIGHHFGFSDEGMHALEEQVLW